MLENQIIVRSTFSSKVSIFRMDAGSDLLAVVALECFLLNIVRLLLLAIQMIAFAALLAFEQETLDENKKMKISFMSQNSKEVKLTVVPIFGCCCTWRISSISSIASSVRLLGI